MAVGWGPAQGGPQPATPLPPYGDFPVPRLANRLPAR